MTSTPSTKKDSILEITPPPTSARDVQLAVLQAEVEHLKDSRNEERYWIGFAATLIADAFLGYHIGTMAFVLIFLLQLIPLIYFAKRLGIDEVAVMLDRIAAVVRDCLGTYIPV